MEYLSSRQAGSVSDDSPLSAWSLDPVVYPGGGALQLTDGSSIQMTSGPETRYIVRGGNPLQGTVFVQGAKNAALKMIAASLLAEKGRTVLRNVPVIEDVRRAVELAQAVGAVVKFHEAERTLVVDASELTS